MPATARDTQRQAVYRWESSIFTRDTCGSLLSLAACQELVNAAWRRYLPITRVPRVLDGRARRRGCWDGWDVRLPRATRHAFYVLHEVAHGLLDWHMTDTTYAAHGPEFARLLMELWDHHLDAPTIGEMRSLGVRQRPRRVRFARVGEVPRPLTVTAFRQIENLTAEAAACRARLAEIKLEQRRLLELRS